MRLICVDGEWQGRFWPQQFVCLGRCGAVAQVWAGGSSVALRVLGRQAVTETDLRGDGLGSIGTCACVACRGAGCARPSEEEIAARIEATHKRVKESGQVAAGGEDGR